MDRQNPLLPSSENAENSGQQVPQTILPRMQVQIQPENSQDNSTSSRESFSEPQNQRTRSLREIHQQLDDFEQHNLFALMSCQPTSFKEATKDPHWVQAMNQEIDSIEKNKTWDLVDLPSHKKSIGFKWVYKTKLNEKGKIEKHKARLVAKGFSQQPGTDYDETFAPVARLFSTEKDPIPIFCDNTLAIALSKNHVFHKKRKHIDTRFHFIRELVNNGDIVLQFCGSRDQLADIFTNPLRKLVFDFQRQHLGIINADICNC
jgi:hypothetical protein